MEINAVSDSSGIEWDNNELEASSWNGWEVVQKDPNEELQFMFDHTMHHHTKLCMMKPNASASFNVKRDEDGDWKGEIDLTYKDEFPNENGDLEIKGHAKTNNKEFEITIKYSNEY